MATNRLERLDGAVVAASKLTGACLAGAEERRGRRFATTARGGGVRSLLLSDVTGSVGKSRVFAEVGFVVMWSSGFIGAKLGTQEASTPTFITWRSLFAAGMLLAAVLLLRRCWPGPDEVTVQGTVGLLSQGVY